MFQLGTYLHLIIINLKRVFPKNKFELPIYYLNTIIKNEIKILSYYYMTYANAVNKNLQCRGTI